jgi:hypothetical protein
VAAPIGGWRRRALPGAVGLLAVGFLAAMVVSGHLREGGQFVKFKPAGVLLETPDQIDRVELRADGRRRGFVRAAGGWRGEAGDGPVPAALAAHLDSSLRFMYAAAPVRVLARAEWAAQGLREFGLDRPGYAATLYRGGQAVLGADFGATSPQKVFQYMKLEGRDQVYLMPRFIGEEWEQVLKGTTGS